jgi:hypothetical protein
MKAVRRSSLYKLIIKICIGTDKDDQILTKWDKHVHEISEILIVKLTCEKYLSGFGLNVNGLGWYAHNH